MSVTLRPFQAVYRPAVSVTSVVLLASLVGAPASAQQSVDFAKLGDEAVRLTQEYLRINTTNPPGNETRGAAFFARIFAAEGIPFDTGSSAPGRGNIWARLEGGSQPALVLLHHMDVVPADPKYWSVDPFAASIKDGYLYGRGALDTKSLGISELMAFLALHRAKVPLDRDVIFVATADEEAGGTYGAGWMAEHHPEVFRGVGFLLNEGGGGEVEGDRKTYSIEVTQKTPLWLKLTATGRPGHGSTPRVASAVNRLIRALDRLQTYEFEPRIGPAVDAYFKAQAPAAPPELRAALQDMAQAVKDREFLLRLQLEEPGAAALTRNTCSITMLAGSPKVNVIPPEASAQLDCRLLPEQDHAAFLRELAMVLDDPGIEIEKVLDFTPAVSPTETPLWNAIVSVTKQHFPDAIIAPAVSTGFTDSHFFRDLGIVSYGYAPFLTPAADDAGVHGNDERLSVDNVKLGARMMYEIVSAMVSGRRQ